MREAVFIKQNMHRWKKLEGALEDQSISADELSDLYIQTTDDLSYAKTFYAKSKITQYLNSLSLKIYHQIYKNKKMKKNRFISFWAYDVPMQFALAYKEVRLSFFIFSTAILIGVASTAYDENFPRIILGDFYVNMTNQNIEKGDPMAVYKQMDEANMFLRITMNNFRVSLNAFVMGVFWGLGTAYILVINGIMLGAFQYFFYSKGLFLSSFLTIWIHGTLEISTIVIEGAAGLVVGASLAFPKSFSRLDSFKDGMKRGLKMTVGVTPIIILAGFLEGFVTRYTEMPNSFKAMIISASFAFVFFYYLFYPRKLLKKKKLEEEKGRMYG